jgi:hypothetical protein
MSCPPVEIELSNSPFRALVDADAEDMVRSYGPWRVNKSGYVVCQTRSGAYLNMHAVCAPPRPDAPGLSIDHVNRCRHDQRKSNLRWASTAQQAANRVRNRTVHSELQNVAGVHPRKLKRGGVSYRASFGGKSLGTFKTVGEASAARDKAAKDSTMREFVVYNNYDSASSE